MNKKINLFKMNISNNNNSISLEEDNFFSEPKTNKSKKQGNKNKSKKYNINTYIY